MASELKETPEKYARSPKGIQRVGSLKWWFIALLVLGSRSGDCRLCQSIRACERPIQ